MKRPVHLPQDRPDAAPAPRHTLGPARPEEAAALAALSIEVWLGTYIRAGLRADFADYALTHFTAPTLRARMEDPAGAMLVARDDEGPLGYLWLRHGNRAPAGAQLSETEIVTLYLRPAARGLGLGRQLLAAGLAAAADGGAPRPWLAVNAENRAALAFYAACGLVEVGQTLFRIGDGVYPNLVLAPAP